MTLNRFPSKNSVSSLVRSYWPDGHASPATVALRLDCRFRYGVMIVAWAGYSQEAVDWLHSQPAGAAMLIVLRGRLGSFTRRAVVTADLALAAEVAALLRESGRHVVDREQGERARRAG